MESLYTLLALQSSRLKKTRLCLDIMGRTGLRRIDKLPEKKGDYRAVKRFQSA